MIWTLEVPFFVVRKRSLLPKQPIFETKKKHFQWPNQNSKTTFIFQIFPKFGAYDFYFMNLSLLGAIWQYFNFVDFWAYFGHFSLVKRVNIKCQKKQQKMASNKKMQENKPTLKFNFTQEYMTTVKKSFCFIQRALFCIPPSQSNGHQTWNLSKNLHRRIFRLKISHRQFHLISTVLVGKNTKKVKMEKFTTLAKILHCCRQ